MKARLRCALLLYLCSQLQDVLLQREEELHRLQEENWKLAEFLTSSFVKNLEVQAQVGSPPSTNTW